MRWLILDRGDPLAEALIAICSERLDVEFYICRWSTFIKPSKVVHTVVAKEVAIAQIVKDHESWSAQATPASVHKMPTDRHSYGRAVPLAAIGGHLGSRMLKRSYNVFWAFSGACGTPDAPPA